MSLTAWLYGDRVAVIDRPDARRMLLTYTEAAIARYGLGAPLLSVRLLVRPERYTRGEVRPFLEGLLPEGVMRDAIASRLNVVATDTYGLLAEIGADCAGALIIIPSEEPAPVTARSTQLEALSERDIVALLANLRSAPLGIGEGVRLSLGGVQEKLLLTRRPDGAWARPLHGAPSTHILKPAIALYDGTVQNEAFCMRLAVVMGLRAARVEVGVFEGVVQALVVERYDRATEGDGTVTRIHQQDLCQARGILPEFKYEARGGPSLAQVAETMATWVDAEALVKLLQATTFNVLIGNGDAHGKNFSLLHRSDGSLEMAPLYDLMSTAIYPAVSQHLAMTIDGVHRIDGVAGHRIVNEAVRWGMSRRRVEDEIAAFLDRAPEAIDEAARATPDAPERLVRFAVEQTEKLRSSIRM